MSGVMLLKNWLELLHTWLLRLPDTCSSHRHCKSLFLLRWVAVTNSASTKRGLLIWTVSTRYQPCWFRELLALQFAARFFADASTKSCAAVPGVPVCVCVCVPVCARVRARLLCDMPFNACTSHCKEGGQQSPILGEHSAGRTTAGCDFGA